MDSNNKEDFIFRLLRFDGVEEVNFQIKSKKIIAKFKILAIASASILMEETKQFFGEDKSFEFKFTISK